MKKFVLILRNGWYLATEEHLVAWWEALPIMVAPADSMRDFLGDVPPRINVIVDEARNHVGDPSWWIPSETWLSGEDLPITQITGGVPRSLSMTAEGAYLLGLSWNFERARAALCFTPVWGSA